MDRVTGLQLFIRVVETGSFSKAAEELHVAQPTATKHVAALEQRLGVRLLHRSTRGVTPTEVGALYYESASRSHANSTMPTTSQRCCRAASPARCASARRSASAAA